MMDYTVTSLGLSDLDLEWRECARTQIDALLWKLKGAQSASDWEKCFGKLKYRFRSIFNSESPLLSLEDMYWDLQLYGIGYEPEFDGAQGLRFRMRELVRQWEESMTTSEPEFCKLETEIMLQVRRELRQFGQSLCESLKWKLNRWAKARKTGTSEANANPPFWMIRRAEALGKARAEVVEAKRKIRLEREEMLRRVEEVADAAADAAAEEVWRRVEAQKMYTGSATATNSDLDDKMWTSILEELCEKATTAWSIARTEADELSRIGDAIKDEKRRTGAANAALCLSWRAALSVADAAADAAAEEVWRRVEAQKMYTGSATATNSDLDDKMWTSILEELCEKATTAWSIAKTEADELSRIGDAIKDEERRTGAANAALCLSWRAALSVAEAVWSEAGRGAEEVWRRAGAANLMKAAEEDWMQSLEDMLTRLMAKEGGGEEDDLREKQDEEARLVYAVAMSAVAFLALVYLYLVGLIDRGGTKTYSPGSRVFRSTFASIVLVLGFYVWFKFRDPATRKLARRGYCRPGQTMIEARYKPPRESGNNNYISFGRCATHEEAWIKKEIAAFLYGQHTGWLDFEDEHPFHILPTHSEQANLSVEGKREWVKSKVMEVYEDVKRFRASISQLGQSGANLGHHLPNPPAEQPEQDPPVALNPEFRLEDMDPPQDVDAGSSKFDVGNVPDSPWVMIDLPGLPDAEPQLVQNSTLDLRLALKLVSCLEQRIAEKDRQIEEQARIIVELKREVELERSFSHH